jgi:hypothetical protein
MQQLDGRPRRLYQAWKGNNVRASSIHLTRRLSFQRICGSPPIQAHHVYSARVQTSRTLAIFSNSFFRKILTLAAGFYWQLGE